MTKVLVVDDDPDIRAIVALLLTDAGYEVLTAANGGVGLEALRREPRLVVLLDLLMPLVTGYDVMEAVEADPALAARHRFIIITANRHSMPEEFLGLLEARGIPALYKPFDLNDLLEQVDAAARELPAASG